MCILWIKNIQKTSRIQQQNFVVLIVIIKKKFMSLNQRVQFIYRLYSVGFFIAVHENSKILKNNSKELEQGHEIMEICQIEHGGRYRNRNRHRRRIVI